MADREKLDVHGRLMGLLQRTPYISCADTDRQYAVNWLMNNGVTVRERGRWEWYTDRCEDLFLGCDEDYGWRCNRCKTPLEDCDDPEVHPTCNFCPNCGADMRGEEDG